MSLLAGKQGVILGIANHRSIAWGIAEAMHAQGARLAFNFPNERMEPKVLKLVDEGMPGSPVLPMDVTKDDQVAAFFSKVGEAFGGRIDFLIHSLAFANREDLEGRFVDTSRDGFMLALDVSAYSLVSVTRAALPYLRAAGGGSIATLTYLGAERAVEKYNVMGVAKAALESAVRYLALDLGSEKIRVNAISAGPVNTLSARGIKDFTTMLNVARDRAPLRRNVELAEIGGTAVFLASDLSAGITGETLHVDCGYSMVGI